MPTAERTGRGGGRVAFTEEEEARRTTTLSVFLQKEPKKPPREWALLRAKCRRCPQREAWRGRGGGSHEEFPSPRRTTTRSVFLQKEPKPPREWPSCGPSADAHLQMCPPPLPRWFPRFLLRSFCGKTDRVVVLLLGEGGLLPPRPLSTPSPPAPSSRFASAPPDCRALECFGRGENSGRGGRAGADIWGKARPPGQSVSRGTP